MATNLVPLQLTLEGMPPPALSTGAMCIRIKTLAAQLRQNPDNVRQRIYRLVRLGLVERKIPGCYALTKMGQRVRATGGFEGGGIQACGIGVADVAASGRPPPAKPVKKPRFKYETTLADRLWRALRLVRKASVAQLVELAARPGEQGIANAQQILGVWKRHGVVRQLKHGRPPRYLLVRDLGPLTPRPSDRYERVWDANARAFLTLDASVGGVRA